MEKLNSHSGKLIVDSGKLKKIFSSCIIPYPFSTIHYPLLVLGFILCFSGTVFGQNQPKRANNADDSVVQKMQRSMDSVMKADSLERVFELEQARQFMRTRQLANQRAIRMTGDTIPDILRISGIVPKDDAGKTKLTFTIKSGKKTLFEDSWLAEGYFDAKDNLPDSVKLKRLSTIVTIFFSNDNFELVDSSDFKEMMSRETKAEIEPNSAESRELFQKPRQMYSVFHSRDYWYGLIWDPKKEKFVKAWRN